MNRVGDWRTTARILEPIRAEVWRGIVGGDMVPIVSIVPERVSLPGHCDAIVYMLDLKALDAGQRERLVEFLADKFEQDSQFVEDNLDAEGVPVLADDVVATSTDRVQIMNLVL